MHFSFSVREGEVENAVCASRSDIYTTVRVTLVDRGRWLNSTTFATRGIRGRESAERLRVSDSDAPRRRGWFWEIAE